MSPMNSCVFCQIVGGTAPAEIVREWPDAIAIVPLNPVVEDGHVLVIPRVHVPDAFTDPIVTGMMFARAAELGAELFPAANLITSIGGPATQTVFHFHTHAVRRVAGDRLPLPWTPAAERCGGVMTAVDLPIPVVVTRYKCPHCHRSRSSKSATTQHMTRCWYNPAAKGCKTCANYYPGDDGCGAEYCNCSGPESCGIPGIDLDGRLRVHCDQWAIAEGVS